MNNNQPTINEALADVITQLAVQQETVAIPGFGSFSGQKVDEHIVIDQESGIRTLHPPKIELKFTPSVLLRKKL